MKSLSGRRVFLVLALSYTLVLLVLSLVKIREKSMPVDFDNADKVFHFFAYFGLTLIWHAYYLSKTKLPEIKINFWIALACVGFGIVIEVLQGSVTNYRSFEGYDILANSSGVILALIALFLLRKKKIKWR